MIVKRDVIDILINKASKESELTWDDIKEETKLPYSRDHIRKMASGIKLYDDYLKETNRENMTIEEIDEINEKIVELRKERTKLSDIRTYINRKTRELARKETMYEFAKDVVEQMNGAYPLLPSKTSINNDFENEGVLTLSDLHIGLETNNNWNKFDLNILKKRLSYLRDKTIEYGKLNKVKRLHVVIIGDVINGLIHTTTRIENREDVSEQSILAGEILSELISDLSHAFDITVHYSVGNHDRITANKSDSIDKESFGYLIKYIIKLRCQDLKNVMFSNNVYDEEIIFFNSLGWKIVATHGDKFGKKDNMIQKLTSMLGFIPDFVFMGHLHHNYLNSVGNSELIINSSVSGTDTYSKNFGLINRPSQNLAIINKNIGKECLYNIYLDRIHIGQGE